MNDRNLAAIDPIVMNLLVAKELECNQSIDLEHYTSIVDSWAADFKYRCLPSWEPFFHESPQEFRNDIRFFRLGMLCQYLDLELGIAYHADQRDLKSIRYTDPSNLFLNGVIDTRRGTCGSMAALHLAFAWRMQWPVSLACLNSHYLLRFDDGVVTYNIEATQSGGGGFKSDSDEYLIDKNRLPAIAITSGSELRALRPREVLGVFLGLRARHLQDYAKSTRLGTAMLHAESDWLLSRMLFPNNRQLYRQQMAASALRGTTLFKPSEPGHPATLEVLTREVSESRFSWNNEPVAAKEITDSADSFAIDEVFAGIGIAGTS